MSIGVDIKDIPKVSDTDFTITLNAYFIVKWQDSRLVVNDLIKATNNKTGHRKEQQELTALNLAILSTLWLPDVEIRCRGGIYLTSRWCCISRDTSGISRQNSCLESFNSTENLLSFTTCKIFFENDN